MEILRQPPDHSSFISLEEYQSHTPASFHDGPVVLHHYSRQCKLLIREGDLRASPALAELRGDRSRESSGTNGLTAGSSAAATESRGNISSEQDQEEEEEREVTIDNVEVWVTSQKFILFSSATSTGVSIPYPSISLHAIQRLPLQPSGDPSPIVQGLYMQLESGGEQDQDQEEDLEEESISLTIIPQASSAAATTTAAPEAMDTTSERLATPADQEPTETPAEALFTALSACANLHPDNVGAGGDDEDDQDQDQAMEGSVLFQSGLIIPGNNAGGMPPALPGSGGWITAENMHEYFDEEGNWKGGNADGDEGASEPQLGPGAGTVRPRDEQDTADGGGEAAMEGEETKWRRTD